MLRACKYCFLQFYFWTDSINWYDILNVGQRFPIDRFVHYYVYVLCVCACFLFVVAAAAVDRLKYLGVRMHIIWFVVPFVDVLHCLFYSAFHSDGRV